jgi:hypothetical protein
MQKKHKDAALIVAMGGPSALASLLGQTRQCVQNWLTRGIPTRVKLENPELFLQGAARILVDVSKTIDARQAELAQQEAKP